MMSNYDPVDFPIKSVRAIFDFPSVTLLASRDEAALEQQLQIIHFLYAAADETQPESLPYALFLMYNTAADVNPHNLTSYWVETEDIMSSASKPMRVIGSTQRLEVIQTASNFFGPSMQYCRLERQGDEFVLVWYGHEELAIKELQASDIL